MTGLRIGHGFDVHQVTPERALVLGGVTIPWKKGLLGHSDADVLIHAVADALLGAAGLGDIGRHFPDSDPQYKNADSLHMLLAKVVSLLESRAMYIVNIDATIIAQQPKMAPYIERMRENIAVCCHIPTAQVNVKATTTEHLGYTGRGEGIAAHAVCLLEQTDRQ